MRRNVTSAVLRWRGFLLKTGKMVSHGGEGKGFARRTQRARRKKTRGSHREHGGRRERKRRVHTENTEGAEKEKRRVHTENTEKE